MKTSKQIVALFMSLALSTLSEIVVAGDPDPRQGSSAGQSEPAISSHETMSAEIDRDLELVRKLEASLLQMAQSDQPQTLGQRQEILQRLTATVDAYSSNVWKAEKHYRAYVMSRRTLKESCAGWDGVDTQRFEGTPFAELQKKSHSQCVDAVADMDAEAFRYARRLDEAAAFLKELDRVTARVKEQIDRIRIAMRAKGLKQVVGEQLKTAQDSPVSHAPVTQ